MIYLIEAKSLGLVKIGFSKNLKMRMDCIQTHCPVEVDLLLKLDGGPRCEKEFHARFSDQRIRGEWFNFVPEMLKFQPSGPDPDAGRYRKPKPKIKSLSTRRPWKKTDIEALRHYWAEGMPVGRIAKRLGRTAGGITRARSQYKLPARFSPFFVLRYKHQEFYFKNPISSGLKKLLERVVTLDEWVSEGRENYEISRSFHVPVADVEHAINSLRLKRPQDNVPVFEPKIGRRCKNCDNLFVASRFRFRCDACLLKAAGAEVPEYELGTSI